MSSKALQKLTIKTPLIYSNPLSSLLNKNIYLKMDALQPSGSYKDRGMSHLLQHYVSNGTKSFISSSGGNAGLSVATVANIMNVDCHVIVPKTTNQLAIDKIKKQNAKLTIHGENWNEADLLANKLVNESNGNIGYIHPFANPISWKGHSTVIDEIKEQWDDINNNNSNNNNIIPDAIICSVGGGGLLNGICLGLDKYNWTKHTTVITAETIGCDSLYQSYKAKKLITLDKISSIAVTLGARQVAPQCLDHLSLRPHICDIVSDKEAVLAIKSFLNDHRLLVEPACAASLALLYENKECISKCNNIIVQVCGGSGIDKNIFEKYLKMFNIE